MNVPHAFVIEVAGDPTVDWMLAASASTHAAELQVSYVWGLQASAGAHAQAGGSALLTELLSSVCDADRGTPIQVHGVKLSRRLLREPAARDVTRTFTVWEPFPTHIGSNEGVWRMREFLGQQPARDLRILGITKPCPEPPGCLVLDDTNLGFRQDRSVWPQCLVDPPTPARQVILKMTNPLASGDLWELLAEDHADSTTLYASLGDLRKQDARVGQALSWEQISSDIVEAIRNHPGLSRVARVIVSLGVSGAVLVERDGDSRLVFDPSCQEGDWERERPGSTMGLGTCIVASLALHVARSPQSPDWALAVSRGLEAGRALQDRGFTFSGRAAGYFGFPLKDVAETLCHDGEEPVFQCVPIPPDRKWKILTHAYPEGFPDAAARLVVDGPAKACQSVPFDRMGAWASVDRTEIESMRSIRNIMREYVTGRRPPRPLSVAVFGPPGAGKSFAIKQMARESTMAGSTTIRVLEFNLSQCRDEADLAAAFRRLRDCAVEGDLPLVFWDEFDASYQGQALGWLSQFLAPMQDGVFLEDGAYRPIGPAIFVFAGGTFATMASFREAASPGSDAKATDFISRLRGFVDIIGPNRTDDDDHAYILRRALLLRALLEQRAPQIISDGQVSIDPGVLRAFLEVPSYLHGARSMQSVIEMSALSGKLRYVRSALPAEHQLSLHVDAEAFLALIDESPPS